MISEKVGAQNRSMAKKRYKLQKCRSLRNIKNHVEIRILQAYRNGERENSNTMVINQQFSECPIRLTLDAHGKTCFLYTILRTCIGEIKRLLLDPIIDYPSVGEASWRASWRSFVSLESLK